MNISRRAFLAAPAALSLVGSFARAAGAITISVDASRTIGALAPDYMGLGYEISSVAVPGLLSATNQPYVELVQGAGGAAA